MENKRRGPIFGDFVTILTESSMQDVRVEMSRVIFTAIAIRRKIGQCYCVHRVILADITKGESVFYLPETNIISLRNCC
jgi:hypothetical protein